MTCSRTTAAPRMVVAGLGRQAGHADDDPLQLGATRMGEGQTADRTP